MTTSLSCLTDLIHGFCAQTSPPYALLPHLIAQSVVTLPSLTELERWTLIEVIANRSLSAPPSQAKALKRALCDETQSRHWKEGLLSISLPDALDLHHVFIKYDNSLNSSLFLPNRWQLVLTHDSSSVGKICAALGSSFATNRPTLVNKQGHNLLDAVYASSCFTQTGEFRGFCLALGDGSGGHFGDLKQDEIIGRTAHLATKTSARLLAAYHTPERLIKELPLVAKASCRRIEAYSSQESTTLLSCRAFPVPGGFRVIGFNIGDNMLIAWNPSTAQASQLFASHVSEAGTALIPSSYKACELQTIDVFVPENSFLFLLSDGVHDTLPFEEKKELYPNGLEYKIRTLSSLTSLFGSVQATSVGAYLTALVTTSLKGAEEERQSHLQQPHYQIGDDFSIVQCCLQTPSKKIALEE